MVSEKFRQQMRQEAQGWQADGLISSDQYQALAERYQFDQLDADAHDRFVIILIGLGSVLLGLGVITFVAANWQAIPRLLKVLLLVGLLVGVNGAGFYLWQPAVTATGDRQPARSPGRQRLGHGLLLLGALTLGANIALMGQTFHQDGPLSSLYLLWGLGVLAMAFGLRLTSLAVLAQVLMGIGYWLSLQDLWWDSTDGLNLLLRYMPLVAAVLFLPLAYWCRSRVVFVLGAIAIASSLVHITLDLDNAVSGTSGILLAIAAGLPLAWLWSYDTNWLRRWWPGAPETMPGFRPLARVLATLYLAGLLFGYSFHWSWSQASLPSVSSQLSEFFASDWWLYLNLNLLVFAAITLAQWIYGLRPQRPGGGWGLSSTDGVVLVFILTLAVLLVWHWHIAPIQAIATFLVNVMLFMLGSGLIRDAIAEGQRRRFWGGMVLLSGQILSRVLEYDTGLLLKSLIFLLCGVAVIVLGLWFERYVRSFNQQAS
jgi:uncharacterized membrane protein